MVDLHAIISIMYAGYVRADPEVHSTVCPGSIRVGPEVHSTTYPGSIRAGPEVHSTAYPGSILQRDRSQHLKMRPRDSGYTYIRSIV